MRGAPTGSRMEPSPSPLRIQFIRTSKAESEIRYIPGAMDLSHLDAAVRRHNLYEVRDELHRLFPREAAKTRIEQLAAFAVEETKAPVAIDSMEEMFLECIQETKRMLRGGPPRRVPHRMIGTETDFLSDRGGVATWIPAQCLCHILLGLIEPRRSSVVVSSMRDDGIYILEWIAHYLAIGFQHFIIYTNDNSDGSEELLRILAAHGIITLIESETSGEEPPEGKAFGHAVQVLHDLRDYEWALFVDSDEYFVPAHQYNYSVAQVLSAVRRQFEVEPPAAICYDWLWFVSGMTFARRPGLLLERFQHARTHHLTKSLVRVADVTSMRRDHFPEVKKNCRIVDSTFRPVDLKTIFHRTPRYEGGRVNHYWARSFEEFAVKKARGATLKLETNLYDRPYSTFFAWNGMESSGNHFPPDRTLLWREKWQIAELKKLEGVSAISERLDRNFPDLVRRAAGEANLREIYEQARTDPVAL